MTPTRLDSLAGLFRRTATIYVDYRSGNGDGLAYLDHQQAIAAQARIMGRA